jgi:hypothetical protein
LRNQVNVQIDEYNKQAVEVLLTDADLALALTELEDVRGNKEILENTIVSAYRNYIDLVRRSRPLIMSDGDLIAFQRKLDRLSGCLHLFGVSVFPRAT